MRFTYTQGGDGLSISGDPADKGCSVRVTSPWAKQGSTLACGCPQARRVSEAGVGGGEALLQGASEAPCVPG